MKPYYCSENPLEEALEVITGKRPPTELELSGVRHASELDDAKSQSLSDWCTQNARPHWATGDSILEAAELIVLRAQENANI